VVDAELHGGGVDLGAIVEGRWGELERVEQAVGRHLPRLGGVAHDLPSGVMLTSPQPRSSPPTSSRSRVRLEVEVGDLGAVETRSMPPRFGVCASARIGVQTSRAA